MEFILQTTAAGAARITVEGELGIYHADEIKQRLARIAGRELGADEPGHEAGANAIRDRLNQVVGRDKPDLHQKQQQLDEERKRQLEQERQRERDRDIGWEL